MTSPNSVGASDLEGEIGCWPPARADRDGTVLPRTGLFWGTRPPMQHATLVLGELAGVGLADETRVLSWLEPHVHVIDQTVPSLMCPEERRLENFVVEVKHAFPLS